MRPVLVFVGVSVLSLIASYAVGLQLADYFPLQEEFVAVLLALQILALIAIIAFAIVYMVQPSVKWLGITTIALAVIAVVITVLPALADAFARRSTNPGMVGSAQDRAILASMLLPAFTMLIVQWPL